MNELSFNLSISRDLRIVLLFSHIYYFLQPFSRVFKCHFGEQISGFYVFVKHRERSTTEKNDISYLISEIQDLRSHTKDSRAYDISLLIVIEAHNKGGIDTKKISHFITKQFPSDIEVFLSLHFFVFILSP